ncbi:MAG: hypothetical protein OK452_01185 [Thaumarchaeota archaeon]|nr:hypothetical protein [Nitrososphaerota archaeon]
MKRSQVLAASFVALMVLSAFPLQQVQGQGAYSEKLNVFIAGSDALWYFSFNGINGSSKLSALESTAGLAWYNVTAIKTTGWKSDFQLFGTKGYNLLPVPFTPSQGLFLTVGSDSYADASAAASALGSYMLTSFVSLSNGTVISLSNGTSTSYSFHSPISFGDVVPSTLLSFLPTVRGGFASAISSSGFQSTLSPFVVLEGQKSGSGFSHDLVVGSISAAALDSSNRPNILGYFGSTVTSLKASGQASSSIVQIKFLDGIVSSADPATVTHDSIRFTGSYTLNVQAGKQVTRINATVVQVPPVLLATRAVDGGVLRTGDYLAVTIILRNLSPATPITKVTFSDNWWNSIAGFRFASGNFTAPSGTISAGGTVTPVYRVQYNGTSTGSITIPASIVRYSYLIGGSTFNATAVLNPIRLSLGKDDAIVYASVTPSGGFGKPVGASQGFNVTVTNVGTLPASTVVVAGHSIPGLAAKSGSSSGGSATVSVSQMALGLLGVNFTRSFGATYQDPAGSSLNATTNVVSDVFSHSSMRVGLPSLVSSALLAPLSNHRTNLTLTFTTSNPGLANITTFSAKLSLPAGLGCGKVSGAGISCSGNQLSIIYRVLNISSTANTYMKYNLTNPLNYFVGPIAFQGSTSGINMTGKSNPVAVPSGVVLSKQFSPSSLFGGMSSTVTILATNAGPLTAYNFTLSTSIDSFDSLASSASLTKTVQRLTPGGNSSLSYAVTVSGTSGNLTASAASANFFFGGTSFSTRGLAPVVRIYTPVSVSIATTPATPEEGKNFTINFQITNPSGVPVSNVLFTLPVPSGLALSHLRNAQVSGGTLTISSASLSPHSSTGASAVAVASSGILVPFDKGKLTFSYSGVTINGIVPSKGIAVGEDVTTRYLIPTAFILLVLLVTALYVRRKAAPSAPSPPK